MGRKLLLEHDQVQGINTFEVYRSKGGYGSVEKALKTMTPDAVTEQVKLSGLRGRGGAGFPAGVSSIVNRKNHATWCAMQMKVNRVLLKTGI